CKRDCRPAFEREAIYGSIVAGAGSDAGPARLDGGIERGSFLWGDSGLQQRILWAGDGAVSLALPVFERGGGRVSCAVERLRIGFGTSRRRGGECGHQ